LTLNDGKEKFLVKKVFYGKKTFTKVKEKLLIKLLHPVSSIDDLYANDEDNYVNERMYIR
jgi:hypothetical protein